MNEIIVEFIIFSKYSKYDEITNILGVDYDIFCDKLGILNNNKIGAISEEYIWGKKSGIDKYEENLDVHLESLLSILIPLKNKLLFLKEKGCTFQLSIINYYYSGVNPGIHLEPKFLAFIGEIGSSVDIDTYCLYND